MAFYSSPTTTISLEKSPAFSSILNKTTNYLNGFRRRNHIQPLKIYSSSSAVVNFQGSSIKQPSSLGSFYSLQRNNLGFSIGAANVNGGGGGETEKKKKEVVVVDDNELADVPVVAKVIGVVADVPAAAKFIGVVAGTISMNVALLTITHHIDALASAIYSHLVPSTTPTPDLTAITMLTSVVVAIAEVTVQGSSGSQPYLLTLAGIVGFAAMKSIIPQPLCWIFLVGFVCYSRFVKRKDYVSSAFPSVAVMTVVGGPWVRLLVIGSYAALAIYQRTKKLSEAESDASNSILLPAALAIGFTLSHGLF